MFTLYSGAVFLVMDLLFSSPKQFPLHTLARVGSVLEGLFQSCPFCMQVLGLAGGFCGLIAVHGEGGMSVIAGMRSTSCEPDRPGEPPCKLLQGIFKH